MYKYILSLCLMGFNLTAFAEVVTFNSEMIAIHKPVDSLLHAAQEELLEEPSMNQASVEFALKNGGPITADILQNLRALLSEDEFLSMRVDIKVQTILPNSYANDPGWHSDYFGKYDKTKGHLVRRNPGFENLTKMFLIISGEPATEFSVNRNIDIDFKVPSWDTISEHLDGILEPESLFRIPAASPIELRGNELHRVTQYFEEKPTVRYLMRATVFPKKHNEYGKFKNEFFSWEIFDPSKLESILGDVTGFLDQAFKHIEETNLDVSGMEMTHLAYRVATMEEYESKKEELGKLGQMISEVQADGRPFAVFKLNNPITYQGFSTRLIALPAPKPNNPYATGLQHVAFIMKEDISTLLDRYPNVPFDTQELQRTSHPEIKLRFPDLVVKFHNLSLEDLDY